MTDGMGWVVRLVIRSCFNASIFQSPNPSFFFPSCPTCSLAGVKFVSNAYLTCKTTPLFYNTSEQEVATDHFYHILIIYSKTDAVVPICLKGG